jgi:cellulose biosynthesis protein BcsQ
VFIVNPVTSSDYSLDGINQLVAAFEDVQGVFKKDRTFAINTLLLILQHFKHCPL